MHPELNTLTAFGLEKRRRTESPFFENVRNQNNRFLYIGKSDEKSLKHMPAFFQSGTFAKDFASARLIIDQAHYISNNFPGVIFIDMPLVKSEVDEFCSFLSKRDLSAKTLLIYHKANLDAKEIGLLKKYTCIDDIIDIDSPEVNYFDKICFLKKFKSQQENIPANDPQKYKLRMGNTKKGFSHKRLFDIAISSGAILLASPLFILICLTIKLGSKGPVFYSSRRAGRGFKIFKFYKFRTMEVDADQKVEALAHLNQYAGSENGAKFLKLCNDPRVTKVGKFLRKTSLDELPQLFNVLKGDMSLVGNRPLPLYEASTLTTNEFVERFMAPAGMTGLWQVTKRGKPDMSVDERIKLDITYARKYSFLYDAWIIAQTPGALFQKTNV
jgi:lipopolysaccharide/colanic/teichoic acid biosynthesis glycosyltransferase